MQLNTTKWTVCGRRDLTFAKVIDSGLLAADQFDKASENTSRNLRFGEKVAIDSVTSEDFEDAQTTEDSF
jgi:hypothetical protein